MLYAGDVTFAVYTVDDPDYVSQDYEVDYFRGICGDMEELIACIADKHNVELDNIIIHHMYHIGA